MTISDVLLEKGLPESTVTEINEYANTLINHAIDHGHDYIFCPILNEVIEFNPVLLSSPSNELINFFIKSFVYKKILLGS